MDSIIVEPGPFATELIDNSPQPEDTDRLESYGNLANAANQTMQHFQQFMKNNPDCDPNLVADAILKLINMKYGERPIRTTCGIDYGVNEINSLTEKYQLDLLKQMELENLNPNKN